MKLLRYKSSKLLLVMLLLSGMLIFTACNNGSNQAGDNDSQAAAKPVQIKFATVGPDTHPYTIGAAKFKELVEAKSNGQIQVTLFPNGQLGSEREMAEGVKMGTIQMTAVTSDGTLPAWVPEMQIFSVPYLFRDAAHAYQVLDGEVGEELNKLMEAQGLKQLGFWELGWRHFSNNEREVKTADDMKGLRIRVQEAKVWFALTDALGATAQPLPFTELYTALQQGVVDGQENPPASIRSMKFYEVQKYLTLDAHTYAPGSVLINPDFFNGLTPEQQKWIQEAVDESEVYQRETIAKAAEADIEFLKTEGKMIVTEPDRQSFVEATKDIPAKITDLVPLELIEKVIAVQ